MVRQEEIHSGSRSLLAQTSPLSSNPNFYIRAAKYKATQALGPPLLRWASADGVSGSGILWRQAFRMGRMGVCRSGGSLFVASTDVMNLVSTSTLPQWPVPGSSSPLRWKPFLCQVVTFDKPVSAFWCLMRDIAESFEDQIKWKRVVFEFSLVHGYKNSRCFGSRLFPRFCLLSHAAQRPILKVDEFWGAVSPPPCRLLGYDIWQICWHLGYDAMNRSRKHVPFGSESTSIMQSQYTVVNLLTRSGFQWQQV